MFAKYLFHSLPASGDGDGENGYGIPELIVLNLEEMAPVMDSFLGGSYLLPYFDAFSKAVERAVFRQGWESYYVNLVRVNSGMTGLMLFVRSDIADRISWVDTAQVGVGVQQMGNKGAAGVRLGYLPTETSRRTLDLTFVAAHLAPMETNFERRNEDWREIVERLVFSRQVAIYRTRVESAQDEDGGVSEQDEDNNNNRPENDQQQQQQGMFTPTSYLFFSGDLNYRTSDVSPQGGDAARYPKLHAEETSSSHYSRLLQNDQLTRERLQGKCFQGLTEAPIKFGPTYKYSAAACRAAGNETAEEQQEWIWSNYRWPSWTDRILYLDSPTWMPELGHVKTYVYDALPLLPTSDHRPVALSVAVPCKAIREPQGDIDENDVRLRPPFPIDPAWHAERSSARTKELLVGYAAYLGLTWQGGGMVLATVVGGIGIWVVLRTLLEG